jgi:hypothetical protein
MVLSASPSAEALRIEWETVGATDAARLSLLSAATDSEANGLRGGPRAVSYRLAHKNTITGGTESPRYAMYRAVATGDLTHGHAIGVGNLNANFWEDLGLSTTNPEDFLAENVVGFQIRVLPHGQSQWLSANEVGDALSVASGKTTSTKGGAPTSYPDGVSAIEVTLTLLTPQGATLLRDGVVSLPDAVKRFGRSYTRRTSILPRP